MKLEATTDKGIFGSINQGQPFFLIRRDCWGIRVNRPSSGSNNLCPNAVLLFKDGSMDTENIDGKELVIPAREVTIRIE